MMILPEQIEKITREWLGWSRAERERMDQIVQEVLEHCRAGTGNDFTRMFVSLIVDPQLMHQKDVAKC